MKVRMNVSIAGLAEPRYGLPEFCFHPGQVVDLSPALAAAWCECGHATPEPVAAPVCPEKPAVLKRPGHRIENAEVLGQNIQRFVAAEADPKKRKAKGAK